MNFNKFLLEISDKPLNVIDSGICLDDYTSIDLSNKNKDFNKIDFAKSEDVDLYIKTYLKSKNKKVAYGGYLEKRNIYKRSSYFKQLNDENERNIHLGIDLWCLPNTKVLTVLDGQIHSFKNNKNFGDYGPTIIVKHSIEKNEFYSLYGHLSKNSLENIRVGNQVYKGHTIGFLGDSAINGDYAPHLHFQLVKDLQSMCGDYPGVCSEHSLEFYKENCPDPNLLLKLN